ncbi:MAG TPA: cobyrinate a,c-diamide synthase, partial [Symbiobacteriaceae bacterium]|nr:cobyrinate a,c-diamide synthase [Symbiobacteriaceae bacterium]
MIPRIIIAAPASGQGKTTIATGLMAALARRGLKVQGFKAGPDYIDPVFHTAATGRPSRNLDTWLMGEDLVLESFERAAAGADIAVIEGVMGLFDGHSGKDDAGSGAHLARLLKAPVLLVVDAWAMARSAAALVHGFATFDPDVRVGAVLLNNLAGEGHYRFIAEALEGCGVPPVGWLKKDDRLHMPERHLGLVPGHSAPFLDTLAEAIAASVDLDAVVKLAASAGAWRGPTTRRFPQEPTQQRFTLAVAQDEAFWFYYQDGLEYLQTLGAEIIPFSPLRDRPPQHAQAVYIGGGYPELHLDELAANQPMLDWLRTTRAPVYAECGGLMYLTRAITDSAGRRYPMVGRLPTEALMAGQGLKLGYVEATALCDHLLAA